MLTDFLIRKFVRNFENTKDKKVRQAYGYLGGTVGIIANVLLFTFKLVFGYLINSIAVMADAVNNLSDAAASVITLIGFKITNKPADLDHPFGHGRVEYISALIVSFLVILVGFEFVKSSVSRIFNPEQIKFDWITVIILATSIVLKLWMSRFNKKLGKAIESKAMEATSLDSLSDVITTSVVLSSILVSKWITFPIDGYIGLLVAMFIIYSGFSLTKETLNPLLGEAPEPELVHEIVDKALNYKEIMGVHDMIIHNYGPGRCIVSLHAEIPGNMGIMDAHEVIDLAEKEISEACNIHLVMHMDPINTDDKTVIKVQEQVLAVIREFENEFSRELTIHDFRLVGDEGGLMNLIFDMVIPMDVNEKEEKGIVEAVSSRIRQRYPQYNAIISIDRQYAIFK